ncbi:unnamed protein product [Mytilus coruscus]|uniref:Novel STAND NTPase 3 domain-containing protein n=1 Tax=Mytilus coruscus TaxID=42192 RepID=A0A6J8B1T1_MYTCO|nr:unnamed protein product [Mytilus coruscus]
MERLGGWQMTQECDQLKTKFLDQTNQEIILDIKRYNDEINDLKKSFKSLKRSHSDMRREMKILKISQQDPVPPNIRAKIKEILKAWKDTDNNMFIDTRAAQQVLKCIQEKSCVTITACSGAGKTATLRHVALQMAKYNYDVLLVTYQDEIIKFYSPNKKTMFVVDDLCGNFSFDHSEINIWRPVIDHLKMVLENKLTKIIVAFHEAEIDKLLTKGYYTKYCALALCVFFNDNVKEEMLKEEVNEETRTIIENVCEACKLNRGTSRTILVDELDSLTHTFRMLDDWAKGNVQDVFSNINMKVPRFREKFLLHLNTLDISQQKQLAHSFDKDIAKDGVINKKIVQLLLDSGADFNQCDDEGQSSVMKACEHGHTEIVKLLLDKGADLNQCYAKMQSSVMKACEHGRTEIVKILLDKGADLNASDWLRNTSIMK